MKKSHREEYKQQLQQVKFITSVYTTQKSNFVLDKSYILVKNTTFCYLERVFISTTKGQLLSIFGEVVKQIHLMLHRPCMDLVQVISTFTSSVSSIPLMNIRNA